MHIPSSTYRIQFHEGFTFRDLDNILDYLHTLGITTIYASPVLKSRKGSMHGYDVIDPHAIDPEIGSAEEFRKLASRVREKGMTWLQDIVPNHMAFDTGNARLMDVLERGPSSPYYGYFDINWNHPAKELKGKVMVPFLGKELSECINEKELSLTFSEGGFHVSYFDTKYPLSVPATQELLNEETLKGWRDAFTEASNRAEDLKTWRSKKRELIKIITKDEKLSTAVRSLCEKINHEPIRLQKLLDTQYYLLAYWKHSEKLINYRRFFTVNELICLRMDEKPVFDEYHRNIKVLYDEGLIHGVRIDHIDGLFNPGRYIERLRNLLGPDCFIIVEKILEAAEQMPTHWQLEGTSGYEFLSFVSQLMTDRQGARKLVSFYKTLVPQTRPYQELVLSNKRLILENYMKGEWDNIVSLFINNGLAEGQDEQRLRHAIGILMLSFPVYRIYPETLKFSQEENKVMEEAFRVAMAQGKEYEAEFNYIKSLLDENAGHDAEKTELILHFLKRLMQFTGPLTAKGVEDTTFYVYNPLISHDEVGDAPSTLGITISQFHSRMGTRQVNSPFSLNATATHDTKRGEDARMRLNVLSEIPDIWEKQVTEWIEINSAERKEIDAVTTPSMNDEWLIYQALIGGYPYEKEIDDTFLSRIEQFLIKALREAKVNSDWSSPNESYEQGCISFVKNILKPEHPFRQSFEAFMDVVREYAQLNALMQVVIKVTAPGIPDIYQGCELWDLSFVDPDNRRPVDYTLRAAMLSEIIEKEKAGSLQLFDFLRNKRKAAYEKMYVTWKTLNLRRSIPAVFTSGDYIPVQVKGKDQVVLSYARHLDGTWVLVVIPLALASNRQLDQPYADDPSQSGYVVLPSEAPSEWVNIFSGERINSGKNLSLFDAFKDFPLAVYHGSIISGKN